MDIDYYKLDKKINCKGCPGTPGCFTYEDYYHVLTYKMSQGMSLDDAHTSLYITNGNMRKLKHNGACIGKSISNLNNAWRAIRDATPH